MIVVGSYPGWIASTGAPLRPLQLLKRVIDEFLPGAAALHLLPYNPSNGTDGFAPRSWYEIDHSLGSLSDLVAITRSRRVMSDGVYNHVGISHPMLDTLWTSPSEQHVAYAFQDNLTFGHIRSPRGGSVLREWTIGREAWWLWQTFSSDSVDIRLTDPSVWRAVETHLRFLNGLGMWCVRLDAAAYYGKPDDASEEIQRHNPKAIMLARRIADLALANGLDVLAQLDCDAQGKEYFPDCSFGVMTVDYSYSAHLAALLLVGDLAGFVDHIYATNALNMRLLRAPRTHDGILLRSGLLHVDTVDALVRHAEERSIDPRIIEGAPYELNSSLPYLLRGQGTLADAHARACLAVVITAFVPGTPYYYLPALLGFRPESGKGARILSSDDPRSLNRAIISQRHLAHLLGSHRTADMRDLLLEVEPFGGYDGECRLDYAGLLLIIERTDCNSTLLCNLSSDQAVGIARYSDGELVVSRRFRNGELEPLGFVVFRS